MEKWWNRWPGRLEWELKALEKQGISYEKEEKAFSRANGALFLRLNKGVLKGLKLKVVFPACYPYLRFEIFSDDIELEHHQNPFFKNLCFIGRASENWHTTDTVASFLANRLSKVIEAGMADDPAIVNALEEKQAEPYSEYYTYLNGHIVLLDSSTEIPKEKEEGFFSIGMIGSNDVQKYVILDVKDDQRNVIAKSPEGLTNLKFEHEIIGQWTRIKKPIKNNDPDSFLTELKREFPNLKTKWVPFRKGIKIAIRGVVFPEEIAHRKVGDGYVFLLRFLKTGKGKNANTTATYFMRTGRSGEFDLAARNPIFSELKTKKVAVIGLGCLGAPSAIELARCGVGELHILDCDFVEPGTSVRWPFGLDYAGKSKVAILDDFISKNYPYTKTVPFIHRLGEAANDTENISSDLEVIERLLDGVDLIYDASAELGLQQLFSDLAKERKIPYISISTTYGAWSGSIVRIHPTKTNGCWLCYRSQLTEGTISAQLQDPKGKIQPASCASPTFTGANFDTQEYALGGVRLAISTLSEGMKVGYPEISWDVANIYLRNKNGEYIPPDWKTFSIKQQQKCSCQKNPKK